MERGGGGSGDLGQRGFERTCSERNVDEFGVCLAKIILNV